jgi:hypothetical protein
VIIARDLETGYSGYHGLVPVPFLMQCVVDGADARTDVLYEKPNIFGTGGSGQKLVCILLCSEDTNVAKLCEGDEYVELLHDAKKNQVTHLVTFCITMQGLTAGISLPHGLPQDPYWRSSIRYRVLYVSVNVCVCIMCACVT